MSKRKKTTAKTAAAKSSGRTKRHLSAAIDGKSAKKHVPKLAITQEKPEGVFPVVGIGASAGGLEALESLFRAMPLNTGMAFVVISHLHPGHISLLPSLLSKITKLPVTEATDGVQVRPDHVYVGPPGGCLAILNGALHLMEAEQRKRPHLPIDYFLSSLATDQKENAICIILSGTGADGTMGLREIKARFGMVMVQEVESAKYSGMPSSAIATGLVDFVLPPAAMSFQLAAYAGGSHLTAPAEDENPAEPLPKISVLLRARTGLDLSGYKPITIRRRIERRMSLHQIGSLPSYLRYLQGNPREVDLLFKELLIGVTSFFRDPEAFEQLIKTHLPELLNSRPENHTLRAWVPGCSSGEEAYSLAIALREVIESGERDLGVQIFGTDLDSEAIDMARAGRYPDGIARDVSLQRLDRFFTREGSTYRIRTKIREMTIFAVQNVIRDAPFTKLDLISCRNLLIYLNADIQKRLLPVFHYALRPGGLLFLGPSETASSFGDLFEPVDKRWKIYRRKETEQSIFPVLELSASSWRDVRDRRQSEGASAPGETNIGTSVERLLLGRFAPASVVVNRHGDALHFHGRTGAYLEPAIGKPRLNILEMAREGLQSELSAAMRQAAAINGDVLRERVRIKTNGHLAYVDLQVTRIVEPKTLQGLFLVTFRPSSPNPKQSKARSHAGEAGRTETAMLKRELRSTKESLQTTIEELKTSNEELRFTNEELQSTNEELQSANEELETSKEEMQSLNEELGIVNSELQSKVDALSRNNEDMENLLNSTQIGTIFLDGELSIKRYTEQARRLANLIQSDVGRPLADLAWNLSYDQLVADCREVLRTLIFKQTEVRTKDGQWFLMRIVPYRTADNVIDGLVLTFADISELKKARTGLSRMSKLFLDAPEPILILDLDGRVIDINKEVIRSTGWSRDNLTGQPAGIMVPAANRCVLAAWIESCRKGGEVRNINFQQLDKAGHEHSTLLTLSLLTDASGAPEAIAMRIRGLADCAKSVAHALPL